MIQKTFLLLSAILLSLCVLVMAQESNDNCCNKFIGRMPTTFNSQANPPFNTSSDSGLFINTKRKVSCTNATVVAWNYCYYVGETVQNLTRTTIHAGIWRNNSNSTGEYELVNETTLPLPEQHQIGTLFVCNHWNLTSAEVDRSFDVTEGDVLGFYIESDGEISVNMFEQVEADFQNELYKVDNPSDNYTRFSSGNWTSVRTSVYLEAELAMPGEEVVCPDRDNTSTTTGVIETTFTTTGSTSTTETTDDGMDIAKIAAPIAAVAGLLYLVLIIGIVTVTCKLVSLQKRTVTKGSGPVIITKLTKGTRRNKKPVQTVRKEPNRLPVRSENSASSENLGGSSQSVRSLQSLLPPNLPPPNLAQTADNAADSANDNATLSPVPVVFTLGPDDDKQPNNTTNELRKPVMYTRQSIIRAQRAAQLPKLDLRRSRSSHTMFKWIDSDSDRAQLTTSTEYPYVVHSFEALGQRHPFIGSLPDMHLLADSSRTRETHNQAPIYNNLTKEQEKYGKVYADVDTGAEEQTQEEDGPSYSYARPNREQIINSDSNQLASRPSYVNFANQDYHYEEYPSEWTDTPIQTQRFVRQATESDDCQSPVYQDIDEYQEIDDNNITSLHPPTNSPSQGSSLDTVPHHNSGGQTIASSKIPPKPKPRNKLLVRKLITQPPADLQGDTTVSGDGGTETTHEYMKLLQNTTDEVSVYTSLI